MHDVIVHELRPDHQIADQLGIDGNRILECVFDRSYRGDAVHQRAHPADTLRKRPGIARVAAAQDDFNATHHGAGTRRLRNDVAVELRLDAQVTFDARHGIDHDGLGAHG